MEEVVEVPTRILNQADIGEAAQRSVDINMSDGSLDGDGAPGGVKRRARESTMGETERPAKKRSKAKVAPASSSKQAMDNVAGSESFSDDGTGRPQVSVYDAVAGRVGYEGLLLDKGGKPLPPDQVLFSRANAPVRYAEDDTYFAHRHLPPEQRLPDSDLLKAIHAYTSDFYGSGRLGKCQDDFGSMDETALLCMALLLEETTAQSLGKTGDLAFVEGPSDDEIH